LAPAAAARYVPALTLPTVTALYAALAALLLIALSVRVIAVRRRAGVALGDGGDAALSRRIRAHGNFIEYVPLALLLMLLMEMLGLPAWLLHALGIGLLGGRLVHAWSLSAASITGRVAGMMLTFTVLAAGAVSCLLAALGLAG
jgi:uncharacterized membrane protein YecN with MAPEG domain